MSTDKFKFEIKWKGMFYLGLMENGTNLPLTQQIQGTGGYKFEMFFSMMKSDKRS